MEQYIELEADKRDAAPEQRGAGTSGGAGGMPVSPTWEPDKKKRSVGEPSRRPVATAGEESARERLKRHRTEMAGRVRVPDMWGQERLLHDWVDCAVFDRPLAATRGLLTARDALVAECTVRALRVQSGCS